MIITNDRRRLVLPEPGDIFKTVIGQGDQARLILVQAQEVEDPIDCSGCAFEEECKDGNKTPFICLGEDRYDKVSVKLVPFTP